MPDKQLTLTYITYEQLRETKSVPKSFWGYWGWLFVSMGKGLKRGFPRNLVIALSLMLAYFLINTFYLAFINDTMYFKGSDKKSGIIYYIYSGIVYFQKGHVKIKGFDFFTSHVSTLFMTVPMLFLLTNLVSSLIKRLIQGGFKVLVIDIFSTGKLAQLYATGASKKTIDYILLGCFWGCLLGFIIQSPITLILLSLVLFLSFTLEKNSRIMHLITMFRVAINMKREHPKHINVSNIALGLLGLAIGLAVYFLLVLMMWLYFDYSIYSRLIFTAIFAVIFLLLYKLKNKKLTNKVIHTLLLLLLMATVSSLFISVVFADDGGWSESGRSFAKWFANPGTNVIVTLGFKGSWGVMLGWLADTAFGGITNFFGLTPLVQFSGLFATRGTHMELAKAALSAVLGPLGDIIADAWKNAINALGGEGGGVDSGTSGGSSEGGSSGGSGGSGSGSSSGNSSNQGSNTSDSGSSNDGGRSGDSGGSNAGSQPGDGGSGPGHSSGDGGSGDGSSSDPGTGGAGTNTGSGSEPSSGGTDSGGGTPPIGGGTGGGPGGVRIDFGEVNDPDGPEFLEEEDPEEMEDLGEVSNDEEAEIEIVIKKKDTD